MTPTARLRHLTLELRVRGLLSKAAAVTQRHGTTLAEVCALYGAAHVRAARVELYQLVATKYEYSYRATAAFFGRDVSTVYRAMAGQCKLQGKVKP